MNSITVETFISFCDDMTIAEETYRLTISNLHNEEDISEKLSRYFISKKDIEEHCAKKHVGFHIGVLLEKNRRSRFIGEFENKFRLVNEINHIKMDNLNEIVDCIVNSSATYFTIEKEHLQAICRRYDLSFAPNYRPCPI